MNDKDREKAEHCLWVLSEFDDEDNIITDPRWRLSQDSREVWRIHREH